MENINERLSELQPYVISIRFPDKLTVVDVKIKDGWELPNSESVGFEPQPKIPGVFMLYPLMTDGEVGVNELLDYVEYFIKVNLEKEEKIDLLRVKIKELQQIFSTSNVQICKSLYFAYEEVKDGELDYDNISLLPDKEKKVKLPKVNPKKVSKTAEGVDGKEVKVKKGKSIKVGNEIVDLPPKKGEKIVLEEFEVPEIVCKCGPNDVCPVCVNEKV